VSRNIERSKNRPDLVEAFSSGIRSPRYLYVGTVTMPTKGFKNPARRQWDSLMRPIGSLFSKLALSDPWTNLQAQRSVESITVVGDLSYLH
jgi:hypothetical protein